MATPTQSVQFRNATSLLEFYHNEEIWAFGIKQRNALCFKNEQDDQSVGEQKLANILQAMLENKTSAIYTLCLYNNPGDEITDKTPCSLSVNFRLREFEGSGAFAGMNGFGGDTNEEIRALRAELKELKEGGGAGPDRLGVIGELMEMDAMQPIVMAIAGKIADFIGSIGNKPAAAGPEDQGLRRVSGPPGWHGVWKEDAEIIRSIDTLADKLQDFPEMMAKLARIALNKPLQFTMFTAYLRNMKA
jgi:hypothetical protein